MTWKRAIVPPSDNEWCWVMGEKINVLAVAQSDSTIMGGWRFPDGGGFLVIWFWMIDLPDHLPVDVVEGKK